MRLKDKRLNAIDLQEATESKLVRTRRKARNLAAIIVRIASDYDR